MSEEPLKRKIVIVGDGGCGKTSLLYVFTLGEFPTEYHPTVFENYVTDCRIDGKAVKLALWDTAGQEEYERLRPLSYAHSHVILIGFAINVPDSFVHARTKWVDEVRKCCPKTPYLLVGLKKDLRDMATNTENFVSHSAGEAAAQQINANAYLESSALTGEGVDDIFEMAARTSLLYGLEDNKCCVIL